MTSQLDRLREVMAELRQRCPWDAQQTHQSLLNHLVEEASEVIDAVETGSAEDLCEELGDLLLQVYFHAQIASDAGQFTLDDVARGICDKLIRRHPHVFAGESAPHNLAASWESRKRSEKGRTSALQGIPEALNPVARAQKVVSRARSHDVAVDLPTNPVTPEEVGGTVVSLVARAQACGVDADAAIRAALRGLEATVREAESP